MKLILTAALEKFMHIYRKKKQTNKKKIKNLQGEGVVYYYSVVRISTFVFFIKLILTVTLEKSIYLPV